MFVGEAHGVGHFFQGVAKHSIPYKLYETARDWQFISSDPVGYYKGEIIGQWNGLKRSAGSLLGHHGGAEFGDSVGQILTGVLVGKLVPTSSAGYARPLVYAGRVAVRAAEGGIMHQFPYSMDQWIIDGGNVTRGENGYIQFNIAGTIYRGETQKVYSGTYQLGGTFGVNGQFIVQHRFFKPN